MFILNTESIKDDMYFESSNEFMAIESFARYRVLDTSSSVLHTEKKIAVFIIQNLINKNGTKQIFKSIEG